MNQALQMIQNGIKADEGGRRKEGEHADILHMRRGLQYSTFARLNPRLPKEVKYTVKANSVITF